MLNINFDNSTYFCICKKIKIIMLIVSQPETSSKNCLGNRYEKNPQRQIIITNEIVDVQIYLRVKSPVSFRWKNCIEFYCSKIVKG